MKVFSFSIAEKQGVGLWKNGVVIDFLRALDVYEPADSSKAAFQGDSIDSMIMSGFFRFKILSDLFSFLEKHDLVDSFAVREDFRYGVPVRNPSKILGLGRNYKAHAEEANLDIPDEPIFFEKTVTSMTPHDSDIVYPRQVSRLDHEIELTVVIGKKAKNITADEAFDYIAGYTIGNDISARDMQERDIKISNPWFRSKSFDTFSPIGPYLVPTDAISDVHDLGMILRVNGEVRQRSNTSKMIFRIPEALSYISEHMTLLPGDIIMTGTPEGISPLQVGDIVEAEIEGIGTLKNRVVADNT